MVLMSLIVIDISGSGELVDVLPVAICLAVAMEPQRFFFVHIVG